MQAGLVPGGGSCRDPNALNVLHVRLVGKMFYQPLLSDTISYYNNCDTRYFTLLAGY